MSGGLELLKHNVNQLSEGGGYAAGPRYYFWSPIFVKEVLSHCSPVCLPETEKKSKDDRL